ncbi:hypothetical protein B0H66DRAFT_470424 [Apodospora peruviana]|uniref:Zn(2)-C6 fungal-type domain-containing protein n=1 Tax=Apodospora peruviana TaxID=516989 RepID=A0AAE0MCQ0_9PEZI|nr:hypothetical protein B0H66DRAFT_470424 [Apodospora peruviana]
MAPYSAIDRRYVMLVRDSEETGAVEAAEFSEQSDLDEQQVVPSHTPLSGSFEDLSRPLATYPSAAQGTTTVFSARATDLSPTGVKERKKRSQFNDEARKETSDTRSVGACLRCRNQRIRCSPNPLNSGAPCVSCAKVSKTNKKTIHRVHCIRYKFTSMIIYRGGGLNITKRFSHNQVVDVGEYADNNIVAIEMAQGLCQTPVRLQVRRFVPRQDDVLKRRYIGEDGVVKEQDLEPFCLADIEKTAKEFKRYINDNALDGLAEAVKDSDDMVKMTFHMIAEECRSDLKGVKGKKPSKQARCESEQKEYLRQVVRLWFAIRHGIGSAWLCGSNTLGMQPVYSPNYSLDGKVAVPRMIVAQFDSIRHERIYKELTASVLKTSEKYLKSWNKDAWFTVYLATFLLLHQTSCASKDRHRWANENKGSTPMETRYGSIDDPLTGFVEKIQDGAVMLLTHWQYFKRCDLLNADWNNPSTSTLQYLKLYQFQHLKNTVAMLKLKSMSGTIPKTPADGCWEDELFWISHMFESAPSKDKETNWDPPESFTRAKPSVGRND